MSLCTPLCKPRRARTRRTLALCAALAGLAGTAQAQCLPSQLGGPGTSVVAEFNAAGAAVAWWCPDRFNPKLSLYAIRWENLTPALHAELVALLRAPDKSAEMARMAAEHVNTPLLDPRLAEVWRPAGQRILASKPPVPGWVVAPGDGTTYRQQAGRLVRDDSISVPSGADCDCKRPATRRETPGGVFCTVSPSVFAACVPAAPQNAPAPFSPAGASDPS
jgi:hypothetical protein